MRAYQLAKSGAGIEGLTKVERPQPKPGHRQVLVKVAACSLNFRDLSIVRGTYRMGSKENVVPLSDGAGEVIVVGSGVTRVKAGDRWPATSSSAGRAARRRPTFRQAQWAVRSTACWPSMSCWRRRAP